jgi:hypothetical protein
MSQASFDRLEHRIEREYEAKGYSAARAEEIGRATAGKTAHKRWAKNGLPAEVKRQRSCIKHGLAGRSFDNRREQQSAFVEVVKDCARQERERQRRRR